MPKLLLKGGLEENLPVLSEREPAITTDTKKVFVGSSSGNVELAKKSDVDAKANQSDLTATNANVASNTSSLADNTTKINILKNLQVSLDDFPIIIPEDSDSPRFQRAINSIKTAEYTESIPTQGSKAKITIPAGRFKVSSKVVVPSYIDIVGAGRHTTIFDSYITNGDPVFHVINDTPSVQQFYDTLQGFTINGRDQNCQGIKIENTSRWILRDIMIDKTDGEGLYLYEAFLGEVYSCMFRACGDATRYSVHLTGRDASNGSHAVSFFGGEINGGTGAVNGFYLKYGTSVALFGTTIEGFSNGIGLTNENGNSLTVNSCYFEGNKEDIVETAPTLGTNYVGNYLGTLAAGSRGHIGIFYAQGCKIEGNDIVGVSAVAVFDSTANSTGKLNMSSVRINYTQSFPINISQSLIDSARTTGTVINSYDGTANNLFYGYQKFKDLVSFDGEMRPKTGMTFIGKPGVTPDTTYPSIYGGAGSPEGVLAAPQGSIYLCKDGGNGITVYIKETAPTTSTGWHSLQTVFATTTAARPITTKTGLSGFDTTLGKPIWWNGTVWKDATGTTV